MIFPVNHHNKAQMVELWERKSEKKQKKKKTIENVGWAQKNQGKIIKIVSLNIKREKKYSFLFWGSQ